MCVLEKGNYSKDVLSKIKGNAIKYLRYKDQLHEVPIEELQEFRYEVEQAFNRIQRETDFVKFVDYDPYKNLSEMSIGIETENVLLVSNLNNDSKLLPGDLNLKFRAVHDYLHYILQQPFNFLGEYKVYQAQKHIHKSKLRRQMLYSEVVLQAAYCEHFGIFPQQKLVL